MQDWRLAHIDKVCFPANKAWDHWANYQHSSENLQATIRNMAAYENSELLIQSCGQTYAHRQYAGLSYKTSLNEPHIFF